MTAKVVKGCPTCEKTYYKYFVNKDSEKQLAKVNSGSSKDSSDKNTSNNLEIDEASSSDINVIPNLLEEVPTLTQLKEIEKTDNDLSAAERATERAQDVNRELDPPSNEEPLNSLNDVSNEDSNQSNGGASSSASSASSSSNAENMSSLKRAGTEEETLLQKYRKLFKAYDVHQQVKITKEQFNTLKSLK